MGNKKKTEEFCFIYAMFYSTKDCHNTLNNEPPSRIHCIIKPKARLPFFGKKGEIMQRISVIKTKDKIPLMSFHVLLH